MPALSPILAGLTRPIEAGLCQESYAALSVSDAPEKAKITPQIALEYHVSKRVLSARAKIVLFQGQKGVNHGKQKEAGVDVMTEEKLNLNAAIHRRKLLIKRMQKAATRASEYATKPSNMMSEFGSAAEQKVAGEAIWQQTEEPGTEYLDLSRKIAEKNASVSVETSKGTFTLAALVILKQTLGALAVKPLKVCHEQAMETRNRFGRSNLGEGVSVLPMFDEKKRNKREEEWEAFLSEINAKLDTANTNTLID